MKRAWLALAAALLGCNAILGVDKDYVEGVPGTGGAGATGGGGGATGGCAGDGGCGECAGLEDCPAASSTCQVATCEDGVCGVEDIEPGTPAAAQTAGDCRTRICDVGGETTDEPDPDDLPVDGNDCTEDLCVGGAPSNPPVAAGTTCAGVGTCDGEGVCSGGTTTLAPSHDSYARSDFPDNVNQGIFEFFVVRADKPARAFIQFDLAAIPPDATVSSAVLALCIGWNSGERTYDLHRVTDAWTESTLSWNDQPGVVATATDSQPTPPAGSCSTWDVTADVQQFVGGTPNHGWRLSDQVESGSGSLDLGVRSKEYTDESLHPSLAITFRVN